MGGESEGSRNTGGRACSNMTGVVSVGHAARSFEEAGIPSVIIMSSVFKDRTATMNPT